MFGCTNAEMNVYLKEKISLNFLYTFSGFLIIHKFLLTIFFSFRLYDINT